MTSYTERLAAHAMDLDDDGHDARASWKQPVRAATTADITIATALNNGDSLDGVTLATGDRVLVKDQTADEQNGIYIVDATPARSEDFDADDDVLGSIVYVIAGTANAGKTYYVTNTAATVLDTDGIAFAEFGGGGGGAPTGADYLVGTANGGLSAEIVVGTTPGGELGGTWASPTVDATHAGSTHLALGTSPSTQAFGDVAAGGAATDAAKTDHKHAMPTLGYGLSGNATPAVGLSSASAFVTAETTISAATYADITGASISLAAGTWLILGQCNIRFVNAVVQAFVAITDGSNNVVSEVAASRPASGTASLNSPFSCNPVAIVSPGGTTTYKLRGARGLTTHTGSWTAMDGNGVNTTNHASNNSDKGTGIFAIRIA